MPISAENRALYPRDWKSISKAIRSRAGHRCEGSPAYPDCRAENGAPHPSTGSKVVLTTAHLDHDPTNNDFENLRSWCQRCHNTYDLPHRIQNAARTRRLALPQMDFFDRGPPAPTTHNGERDDE